MAQYNLEQLQGAVTVSQWCILSIPCNKYTILSFTSSSSPQPLSSNCLTSNPKYSSNRLLLLHTEHQSKLTTPFTNPSIIPSLIFIIPLNSLHSGLTQSAEQSPEWSLDICCLHRWCLSSLLTLGPRVVWNCSRCLLMLSQRVEFWWNWLQRKYLQSRIRVREIMLRPVMVDTIVPQWRLIHLIFMQYPTASSTTNNPAPPSTPNPILLNLTTLFGTSTLTFTLLPINSCSSTFFSSLSSLTLAFPSQQNAYTKTISNMHLTNPLQYTMRIQRDFCSAAIA